MTFQSWIDSYGTHEALAKALDVTPWAIWSWTSRRNRPSATVIAKLLHLSGGKLTVDMIVRDTSPKTR